MTKRPPRTPRPAGTKQPDSRSLVRRVALEVLMGADASGKFVDEILMDRIGALEDRDRHLLQEITYGTLRHRNTLDHLLNFHLKLPASQQKAPVRWAGRFCFKAPAARSHARVASSRAISDPCGWQPAPWARYSCSPCLER